MTLCGRWTTPPSRRSIMFLHHYTRCKVMEDVGVWPGHNVQWHSSCAHGPPRTQSLIISRHLLIGQAQSRMLHHCSHQSLQLDITFGCRCWFMQCVHTMSLRADRSPACPFTLQAHGASVRDYWPRVLTTTHGSHALLWHGPICCVLSLTQRPQSCGLFPVCCLWHRGLSDVAYLLCAASD